MKVEKIDFGKFLNMEKIAQGGMAEIFKAQTITSDGKTRIVAIKKILPQYSNDKDFITMLTDESKLMVTLNHPNIVPVIEFGAVDTDYYLALEFVHGKTLKDILSTMYRQKEKMPVDLCAFIMREIAQGLDYAHRKKDSQGKDLNIIHRDISPTNVLISYLGEVKIVDFGIAKASTHSHVTKTGVIRGKMGYMSPEQTRSYLDIDSRSDIYSAGILMWEMLTSKKLFAADNINQAIKMVRKGQVTSPTLLREEIPPFLDAIVMGSLKHDIKERIQTAALLRDMLNEFLAGLTIKNSANKTISSLELSIFMQGMFREDFNKVKRELKPLGIKLDDTKGKERSAEEGQKASDRTVAANIDFESGDIKGEVRYEDSVLYEKFRAPSKVPLKRALHNKIFALRPIHIYAIAFILVAFMIFMTELYIKPKFKQARTGTALNMRYSRIEVITEPEGSAVWVNGLPVDERTPIKSLRIPVGRANLIRLEKEGYRTEIVSLIPRSTAGERIRVDLKKQNTDSGEITVFSDPIGAEIIIDDFHTNQRTPAVIKEISLNKAHSLLLKLKGYEDKALEFEIGAQAKRFIRVAMEKN